MAKETLTFTDLNHLVEHLRSRKKNTLIFAHNGTGKTRLSMAFKEAGKKGGKDKRDTLYFNAFTEDLFTWDNDLYHDVERGLVFNRESHFFDGLDGADMENRIRPFLQRYADFDFSINYEKARVSFKREVKTVKKPTKKQPEPVETTKIVDNIKVSRGEENIFIWCFFLAVAQMAIDGHENYQWVKYLYIDDPISSLDDNNAIAVASHLAQLLKNQNNIDAIISTHHGLFFNVMHNELKRAEKYYMCKGRKEEEIQLMDTRDTPFFHHVSLMQSLQKAATTGELYTYHFNILRNILEKTAAFQGFNDFRDCIKRSKDDVDGIIHARMINILSHGNYSLFEPVEMQEENKEHFRRILKDFTDTYRFNQDLFQETETEEI